MKNKEIAYIKWFDSYQFKSKTILGTKGVYYVFEADYNIRDESWYVTISTEDGVVLIQNKKLVPNIDLLEFCFNKLKPDCYLIPIVENDNIIDIDYEKMIDETVKLVHITESEASNL